MIIGVTRETAAKELRVALIPASAAALIKAGLEVRMERGAGEAAGFPDAAYEDKGVALCDRAEVFAQADIVVQVQGPGAHAAGLTGDLPQCRPGQILVGMLDPLGMTAAGTLAPAKVFVVGVGVAGLQAIATAKRLGAVVEAYDVRPAVRDQVLSVGAKFVEFDLETEGAEDKGGYAKQQSAEFIRRQQEQMQEVVARNDVVITTAAIPGKKSPVLVTEPMVAAMAPGSVIVDLAAERGGNCELTRADEVVTAHGVTILGPTDLVSRKPYHASQMFARNIETLLLSLYKDGGLDLDPADEVVAGCLLAKGGEVVHPRLREMLDLPPLAAPAAPEEGD